MEDAAEELADRELPSHEGEEAEKHPLVAEDLCPRDAVTAGVPANQEALAPEDNYLLVFPTKVECGPGRAQHLSCAGSGSRFRDSH